jgi:branched-chain amino acid transport system substrate-binding protein
VVAVATALEGMEFESMWGTTVYMRPEDHQAIQDVHITAHTNDNVTFDFDRSGFGQVVESTVDMASADIPTTCEMKRP